ncbi:MAG TPA: amidohydrolase family protein [Burkholderiales bacterium]
MKAAWQGLDAAKVWDAHAHLIGVGDAASGVVVNPRSQSLLSPGEYARRVFFLNASCAKDAPVGVDRGFVARALDLMQALPGTKMLLYAFERAHDERGAPLPQRSGLHVPDAYAREVARAHPQVFEWVASVHPYRADCVEALERAKAEGARAVKWLPSAMNIDPASPRCDRFYEALARLHVPLVAHAGLARAVIGADLQDYGNPLRLRRALDAGVRVVVAHCASMGRDRDLDQGAHGPAVESFALFARLMDEPRYARRLYGDLSAVTQVNRAAGTLARVLERSDWHARLLNGSDYPLPGVMPLFSLDFIVSLGLLEPAAAPVLSQIRQHNPLLFDFVLKRSLRWRGAALAASVFETRQFFEGGV